MSNPRVPSVSSVERLYNIVEGNEGQISDAIHDRNGPERINRTKVLKVIAREDGAAVTGTGLSMTTALFTCEIVRRNQNGTLTATGVMIEVWNDFSRTVPNGQLLEVVRDTTTKYFKIVVWYCGS